MPNKHLLLLSNSTLHPTGYLEYAKDHIIQFLKKNKVSKVSIRLLYQLFSHRENKNVFALLAAILVSHFLSKYFFFIQNEC